MAIEYLWMRDLKALGERQGFLTYAQINDAMPPVIVDPEEINEIVQSLQKLGIQVTERLDDDGSSSS